MKSDWRWQLIYACAEQSAWRWHVCAYRAPGAEHLYIYIYIYIYACAAERRAAEMSCHIMSCIYRATGAGMHVHTERLALNTYIYIYIYIYICMCGGAARGGDVMSCHVMHIQSDWRWHACACRATGAERMCIYRATGAGMHVHEERLALETYICMCRAERLALACMCIQSAWR